MPVEIIVFGLLPAFVVVSIVIASVFLAVRGRNILQALCALIICIAVSLSFLWLYRMFFTVAWPTYLPYLVIGLSVLLFISQAGFFRAQPKTLRWWASSGFTTIWIGGLLALICNIGVTSTETVSARWGFSDNRPDAYGKQVIWLDGPEVSGAVASDEIAKYLKSANPETIPVEIIRIYDLGKLRGWRIQKIAGISNSHLWLDGGIKE